MSDVVYYYCDLSDKYLSRETKRFNYVRDWVIGYCARNKIPHWQIEKGKGREMYLRVAFGSQHQLDCFVRKGNDRFPYFEFR